MKLPDKIFGASAEEAYRKYLEEAAKKPEEEKQKTIPMQTSTAGVTLGDYLLMPQHNLYIAKQKTLHGRNWDLAHEELHKQGARMLTLREFIDFLLLLKSGNVQDGLGNLMSGPEVTAIYNEITEVRSPWRSEWIDAKFAQLPNTSTLQIEYNHRIVHGQLVPQTIEPLEQCVMKNCKVDIHSCNRQGMPTREGNYFNYWHPQNGRVAGFGAVSGGALLGCSGGPSYSLASLGVRAARAKIEERT